MTAAERTLEDEATAMIDALPPAERRGILSPRDLRRRQSRERPLLAPVLATRADDGEAPGDALLVECEWEICARIMDAAGLSERERGIFVMHAQLDLTDESIAGILGLSRWTVNTTRNRAQEKIRAAVNAVQLDPA